MLTYNMDVTPESVWKRTTPSEAELAQPYYCTEAGVFYAQQHFSTFLYYKDWYMVFYTLRGAGLIEQGESHVVLGTGQALLLNCRTPQSYCTAPGQSCWHHYWVHLDGAGVAAMEPLLFPGKKLTPVQLTGVKMQELFEMLLGQMEHSTVDSMVTTGLALHEMLALCARSILAEAETTSARQVILQAVEPLDNQREESIEGQIRECTAYAEKNGITVIKHYIDRAFSAKTDNRPEFQQMIKDSGKKLFDVVLVWKFDRFARNRFDSANYKMILKKNGVHLISVMEPIAEGSQGILVETLLEGMAEYYSAELSEKVIRGQTENALKGKCTGGTGTIGYKIDDDKFYHLDPLTAPLVLEAFQRYDNGDKMVEIVNFLNDKGVRNMLGGKMTHSSVNTMLKNRRYIGELSFRDIVVPDAIPVIVPKDLFDRVQKRLDKNKRAPACGKADEEYLLTTKLFCGKCGALMFGESGTSATGRTYYYYKCANVKRRKGCNKKTVQKDWLEDLVVRETMKLIQDDAVIDKIVQLVMDVQNQENTTIPLLEKQLREVNKKLDNLMKAIEDGLYTRTTKERLEALEIQKDELTAKIADEKLKKPSFNEDFIRFWLMKFRKFDISQKKQRKALIEIFVNAIFLYDDRMLLTFNYKDGTQTVRFEDALTVDGVEGKSLDLSGSAGP